MNTALSDDDRLTYGVLRMQERRLYLRPAAFALTRGLHPANIRGWAVHRVSAAFIAGRAGEPLPNGLDV